jgi:hypothetical protein
MASADDTIRTDWCLGAKAAAFPTTAAVNKQKESLILP